MDTCDTVRVKADNDQGFVVINASDFNEAQHELFAEPDESQPAGKKGGKKAGDQ